MNKLRSKKGFTLTEMLISVLLLGLVSVMVTVMTSAILDSTVTMREIAQAEILGSEALDNIQGQLRVAGNVTVDSGVVMFDIDDANKNYVFGIDDGKIVLGKKEDGVLKGDLLFDGVSYGNLRVTELNFSGDKARQIIEISLEISFGEKTLWKGSVTVKPLNNMTVVD